MNTKQQIAVVKRNRDLASVIMTRILRLEVNLEVIKQELQTTTQLLAELSDDLGGHAVSIMRQSK